SVRAGSDGGAGGRGGGDLLRAGVRDRRDRGGGAGGTGGRARNRVCVSGVCVPAGAGDIDGVLAGSGAAVTRPSGPPRPLERPWRGALLYYRRMRISALLALLPAGCFGQSLQDSIKNRIGGFPGTVSLYAKKLVTGATVGIRDSDPVRTASTIKLPILCAVADQVAQGHLKWDDKLTVLKELKASGSGVIASEFSDGVQIPLSDVAHLMMVL